MTLRFSQEPMEITTWCCYPLWPFSSGIPALDISMHVSMHTGIQLALSPPAERTTNDKDATGKSSTYHFGSSSTVGTRDENEDSNNARRKAFVDAAKKLHNESTHLVLDKSSTFPQFMRRQILLGKILGKGTNCDVCEIRGFQHLEEPPSQVKSEPFTTTSSSSTSRVDKTNATSTFRNKRCNRIRSWNLIGRLSLISSSTARKARAADEEVLKESRDFIASHCFRNGGDARYAIKCLSKSTKDNPERLQQGILDMAMEARILSNFTDHPNVIKMRAVSNEGPFEEVTGGFFIVLDRLYDTLEQRLKKWKSRRNSLTGIVARFSRRDPDGQAKKELHCDRLVAAYDLSSAVAYLHLNRIIHRDLKPANIGFDIRGDIKVFDFGLAKIVPRTGADGDGRYAFTAMCGTLRYMAPEVGLGQHYNESCDTYSFSVLLWEIMTLDRPYGSIKPEALQVQVWGRCNKRPALGTPLGKSQFSSPLRLLIKRGWSREPNERPKMVHVENILRQECIRVRDGDESGLEHSQRRSTHIFNRSSSTRTL